MHTPKSAIFCLSALLLSGCFDADTPELEGTRLNLDGTPITSEARANRSAAFATAPETVNADWPQQAGSRQPWIANPALAEGPDVLWSVAIGEGNARGQRITGAPIVANGVIFAKDAQARVSAVDARTGGVLWQRDLSQQVLDTTAIPSGGLAFDDDRLMVTDGFGQLSALEAATGDILWTHDLDTVAGAPTVSKGIVYVSGRDGTGSAIDADTGRVLWTLASAPSPSNLLRGAAPAVSQDMVFFAFGSGEVSAAFRQGGFKRWSTVISDERDGQAYARILDISGDPIIVGDRLYVGNNSAKTLALTLQGGTQIWSIPEGAVAPVWPSGNAVFMVSDQGALIRIDAATGEEIWRSDVREISGDRSQPMAIYRPILAGGLVRVATSRDGVLSFDPVSGALLGQIEIPGGAASSLAIANETAYVLSTQGVLYALR